MEWPEEMTLARFAEHIRKDNPDAQGVPPWLALDPRLWEEPTGYETQTYVLATQQSGDELVLTRTEMEATLRALEEDDCDPACCPTCAGAVTATEKLQAALSARASGGGGE